MQGNVLDRKEYTSWQWFTANDSPERDPVSFELLGSVDGTEFTALDSALSATITETRNALAYSGNIGDDVVHGPSAPSSIEVTTLSDSTAKVQWSSVDEATGYQLFINDSLVADTTSTEYVFSTIPFSAYTLSVLAYNNDGKSAAIKNSYSTIPENPCLWLVYDRTQSDADRVQQMIRAGYQSLSLEQYTEWTSLMSKGSWNYTDANRVGAAINLIRNLLASSGLNMSNVLPAPVSYDTKSDIRVEDVTQLQESIRRLQQAFETNPTIVVMTPGPNWKYTQANQLEENLHILYEEIKPYYIWPNAYDATCGGEYL